MLIGYAYQAKNAPELHMQTAHLEDEGCVRVYQDVHPDRTERDDMIHKAGLRKGDTLIIAKNSVLGSGEIDTFNTIKAISALGVSLKVVGEEAKLYADDAEMQAFAAAALKEARSANAQHMLENRTKSGRNPKWEMSPKDEAVLRILWHETRVPMETVLAAADELSGLRITRANLNKWLGPRSKS